VIYSLVSTGVVILLLSILVVWTEFMVRLIVGLFILLVSYTFLYAAYRIWCMKKAIEKYLHLNKKK
jgi:Na+-transporting methylmalonyl-CoA/oxaloacetate decarboxylase gamma subunit